MAIKIDKAVVARAVPMVSVGASAQASASEQTRETGSVTPAPFEGSSRSSSSVTEMPLPREDASVPFDGSNVSPEVAQQLQRGQLKIDREVVNRAVPLVTANESILSATPLAIDQAAGLPTTESTWYEDPTMVARAVADGLTFGFSDEIFAGVSALATSVLDDSNRSWDDIYNETMVDLEEDRRIFAEDHPYANFSLQLVGGIVSPANFAIKMGATKALQAFATGADKLKSVTGIGLTRTQRALQQMEQRVPQLAGIERAAAPVSTGRRVLQATGEAAVMGGIGGAIYGAGTTQLGGDSTEGAKTGAAWGVALAPLAAIFPGIAGFVSKRRNTQTLGKGKDFVPATLTTPEGTYGKAVDWIYRNFVSKAYISRSMMDRQAQRWLTPAMEKVENFRGNLERTRALSKQLAKRLAEKAKLETQRLVNTRKNRAADNKLTTEEANRKVQTSTRAQEPLKIQQLTNQADEIVMRTEQAFRAQMWLASIPETFPVKLREEISELLSLGKNAEALVKLRDAWKQYGFAFIDNNKFKFNGDTLADDVYAALIKDHPSVLGLGNRDAIITQVADAINNFIFQFSDSSGFIKGADLAVLRNSISELVSSSYKAGKANDFLQAHILLSLKDVIDAGIDNQLPAVLQKMKVFADHKAKWEQKLYLERAVTNATVQNRGSFTPTNWREASQQINPRKAASDQTPFAKEAKINEDTITAANKGVQDGAEAIKNSTVRQVEEMAVQARAYALQEKKRIAAEIQEIKAKEKVRLTADLSRANREGVLKLESELKALDEELANLTTFQENITALFPTIPQGSGLARGSESVIATLALSAFQSILGGIAVGSGLSTQRAQRLLFGQTALQEWLSSAVERSRQVSSSGGAGAVAGGNIVAQEEKERTQISNASPQVKIRIYKAMRDNGTLERFAEKYPNEFADLEKTYLNEGR